MIPASIIKDAFPNQPRMQQAFSALVQQAEDLVTRLTDTANQLAANQGDTASALSKLDEKQPLNSLLTELSALPTDPGVPEQVQPGSWQIRPIDAADVKSLLSRELADTRYLGGAHAAASATKLATARTIAITGDLAYLVSFDGSANVSAAGTLATVNSSPGTFGSASQSLTATVDGKGRITSLSAQTIAAAWASITGKPTTLAGYGITDAQPLDGDLTSLAAATGTNTIYYRSAADTWSPVVIGTGLGFTGGTLSASGATGAALTKTDDTNVTLTLGGSPATALLAAASLTLGWTGQLAITRGGTGASTASAARTNLGVAIGTDVQAFNSNLTALSGLTGAANTGFYFTGSGAMSTFSLTASGRTVCGASGTTGTGNVVFSSSPTMTGTLTCVTINASGIVNTSGFRDSGTLVARFEGTGSSLPPGSTGVGLEFFSSGGFGYVQSFNRTTSLWVGTRYNALSHEFLISGTTALGLYGALGNYTDDTAAAAAGVPVLGIYRTGSALKVRVT